MRDSFLESLAVCLNHESHAWAAVALADSTRAQPGARPDWPQRDHCLQG